MVVEIFVRIFKLLLKKKSKNVTIGFFLVNFGYVFQTPAIRFDVVAHIVPPHIVKKAVEYFVRIVLIGLQNSLERL